MLVLLCADCHRYTE